MMKPALPPVAPPRRRLPSFLPAGRCSLFPVRFPLFTFPRSLFTFICSLITVPFSLLSSLPVSAQGRPLQVDEGLGTWNIVNVRMDMDARWSLSAEAQLRSLLFYRHFHYYELKGGVGYRLTDRATLFLGMGTYQTYAPGGDFRTPKVNDEFRIWPQFAVSSALGRLKIEHRYRFESRFALQGLLFRFRQRVQATVPLNRREAGPGTLSTVVWNELFLTDRGPYFQRNRFFAGFAYEFTPRCAMQAGWVHQFDYSVEDETGKNFMQVSLLFSLKRKSTGQAPVPALDE